LIKVAVLLVWLAMDLFVRPVKDAAAGAERIHRYCARIVRALGVTWSVSGATLAMGAVVSNHLSYLDILLFSAARPFVMVSKSEVSGWPLIGWLIRQAGTVFVVRGGGPATYPAVNQAMARAFRSGLPVLFFPEGTTTDGSCVLPFRRGLFHSVLNEGVPLQAAAIHYSNDDVCWWGDALLVPHLLRLAAMDGVHAQLRFGEAVTDRRDRFELSESAREQVMQILAELDGRALSTANEAELTEALEDLLDRPVESVGALDGHGCVMR
jgi:1-acyl-sn-glycerol-3-phosphate acyltransferase